MGGMANFIVLSRDLDHESCDSGRIFIQQS